MNQISGNCSEVNLAIFTTGEFSRGSSFLKEFLWLVIRQVLFLSCPLGLYALKRFILRLFGAQIGYGVVIKPGAKITFPWKLSIGDNSWLGEDCWLLNLANITVGKNVCISQRTFLCTGSHDYTRRSFDLITRPIIVFDGAWITANCFIGPGVTVGSHAVLTAGSVASTDLDAYAIYQGIPARKIKDRQLKS